MSEKEEGSVEDDGREREGGKLGAGQTVGWLSLANPRRMYVIILGTRAGGGGERQARRWREAASKATASAFAGLARTDL